MRFSAFALLAVSALAGSSYADETTVPHSVASKHTYNVILQRHFI